MASAAVLLLSCMCQPVGCVDLRIGDRRTLAAAAAALAVFVQPGGLAVVQAQASVTDDTAANALAKVQAECRCPPQPPPACAFPFCRIDPVHPSSARSLAPVFTVHPSLPSARPRALVLRFGEATGGHRDAGHQVH